MYVYFSKWILAAMLCSSGERDEGRGRGANLCAERENQHTMKIQRILVNDKMMLIILYYTADPDFTGLIVMSLMNNLPL